MSPSASSPSSQTSKQQRVLACVRCQQRKIKCDRRYPCANCNRSGGQCVPGTKTVPGPRRRRFPERDLLERIRKYEDLLRRNNIKFEPLHKAQPLENESPRTQSGDESNTEPSEAAGSDWPSPSSTIKSERVYETKDLWDALNLGFRDQDHDERRMLVTKKGWDELFGQNDHLLFGSPNTNIDLSTLHPEPIHIFRLWQTYVENVNPLLKIIHTPSLQKQIIEAASNLSDISPALEALMFGIYCMATLTIAGANCQTIFGSSKEELLTRFQFGCQQALMNCNFLRSNDRDSLTALLLYLMSVRQSTVPHSLSAMLGVALRIAQRMGIHSESKLSKHPPFEAELRRRLWWSLVFFDTRISEMADHKNSTLAPGWDCHIPLNVNESDLSPEMKEAPTAARGNPTDALFAVIRSEIGNFVRFTKFHLDFTNPALQPIFKPEQESSSTSEFDELAALEKRIEEKYLKSLDLSNPLHFITIWWTRAYLSRCHLFSHLSHFSSVPQTPTQCDLAISYSITMLTCDTQLRSSPLSKPFLWFSHQHFPFPAYIQIAQHLRGRPTSEKAEEAWKAMSENFGTWFVFVRGDAESPFFDMFTKFILQAWEVQEVGLRELGVEVVRPRIVEDIMVRVGLIQKKRVGEMRVSEEVFGMGYCGFQSSLQMGDGGGGVLYSIGEQDGSGAIGSRVHPETPEEVPLDIDMSLLDWSSMDWGFEGMYSGVWNMEL